MWFNTIRPIETPIGLHLFDSTDMPAEDWKYADLDHVYRRTSDFVRHVVDSAPLVTGSRYRYSLIDVKVQNLVPGVISCIPGWHLDGNINADHELPDIHHLCVMNGPQTEFIKEPVYLPYAADEPNARAELTRRIPIDVAFGPATANCITTFTSRDFHRGVETEFPTQRLLVRITQSNTIRPSKISKKPMVGAR